MCNQTNPLLPIVINHIIFQLSSNEEVFNLSKSTYEEALQLSGFSQPLSFQTAINKNKSTRKRKTIWYNPLYNKSVSTNIGRHFLHLMEKHFLSHHSLSKIFNKNTIKVSYSCCQNMVNIIRSHNNRIINPTVTEPATMHLVVE